MPEKKNQSEFKSFRDLAQYAASEPTNKQPAADPQNTTKTPRDYKIARDANSTSTKPTQPNSKVAQTISSGDNTRPSINSLSPAVERKLKEKDEVIESLNAKLASALSDNKELEQRWIDEREAFKLIYARSEAFQDELKELRLQNEILACRSSPLHAYPVINWLSFLSEEDAFHRPEVVCVEGYGAISDISWNNYLQRQGIRIAEQASVIIVGNEGWCKTRLESLIDTDDYENVQVFSQELFLAAMFSGKNPFVANRAVLEAFAEHHSAITYLLNIGFEWPIGFERDDLTEPSFLNKSLDRVEESPLRSLGYQVGAKGLNEFQRRRILSDAYRGNLPQVADAAYMAEWGARRTRRRLWRIAHHLAMLIRANNNKTSFFMALDEWSADLDWLRATHYKYSMHFDWPFNVRH
jgi:hypothetical protein